MSGGANPTDPSSGPGASSSISGSTPPCPTPCTIASQTVATSPLNRTRTKIGVGEEVDLTVDPAPATWAITAGSGTLSPSSGSQSSVRFTAGDRAGSVTITATGTGCTCTITMQVVEPSDWTMKRKAGTGLYKRAGIPECGWKGTPYVHPNDVNFYNLDVREKDSQAVASGCYNVPVIQGSWHGGYPPPDRVSGWFGALSHTYADGTELAATDTIYSGYPGTAATGTSPPFTPGSYYWPIVWQWKVGTGSPKSFPPVRQEHEIFSDGKCESRKGGHTERTMFSDPASSY